MKCYILPEQKKKKKKKKKKTEPLLQARGLPSFLATRMTKKEKH